MSTSTVVTLSLLVIELVTIFGLVLLERRQPAATLAWVLAVVFLPVVGVLLYLVFGVKRVGRIAERSAQVAERVERAMERHGVMVDGPGHPVGEDVRTQPLLRLGERLTGNPASSGNRCDILVNASATYESILQAIREATDHIHVQFYIIQPDDYGQLLRERLAARAREGVEVRVLVDAVGSYQLSGDFWRPLEDAGGHAAAFGRVNPLYRVRRRDRIDFRNHRKNVVVDGRIGFTGGINVGREYMGLHPDIGHWRDTHVRIEGPAAIQLQRSFVEDWLASTEELLEDPRYFPAPVPRDDGDSVVQVVDSGPNRRWTPIQRFYTQAIAGARERVWATSPYFVPDAVTEDALVTAALRGVDVRLLLPSRYDHRLVGWAARSYYPTLLDAGVKVYEYARGFVHAKTLVVDDWLATVGSANMDMRSFQLNYELNAFIVGEVFTRSLAGIFEEDLLHAVAIDPASQEKVGYGRRLLQSMAQLMSPLL